MLTHRPHLKAIPTRYAGCNFRSRLEARWAIVFDQLGIRWEYEPEGFDTVAGRYLPDFRILQRPACACRDTPLAVWFEVKPDGAAIEARHRALSAGLDHRNEVFILARGLPRDHRRATRHLTVVGTGESWLGGTDGLWGPDIDADLHDLTGDAKTRAINAALTAARSERFGT